MPLRLPIEGGYANQDIETSIHDWNVLIQLRWNGRDNSGRGAWYMHLFDEQNNAIGCGMKIVLGASLGRGFNHPLFRNGAIVAVDTAQAQNRGVPREATFRDLGTRVRVYYVTEYEIASKMNQLFYESNL